MSRAVEAQPVFHRDVLASLSDKASQSLLELEAWSEGDQMVFETPQPTADSITVRDDLYHEFVKTASSIDHDEHPEETIAEWVEKLTSTPDGRERTSQIFLLAINTAASEYALLALYKSGYVDLHVVDEVSAKNCLHRAAAAASNRMQIIQLALENKVDVSHRDVYGKTPLHYACISGRREVMQLLLKHGAEVDPLDTDNFSPLLYSIVHRHPGCVQDLVDAGAKLEVDSERDYVPLNLACQYGEYESVKILLDKRPDLVCADAEGLYPFHLAARAGHSKLIPLLSSYGMNIDELDKLNQWTALMYAASEGNYETVKALLDAGADPGVLDENGHTALFHACWEGRLKCFYELSRRLPVGPQGHPVDASRPLSLDPKQSNEPEFVNSFGDMDIAEVDGIPDLSLPPPIIPLRRYGHNFLDNTKIILQLLFDSNSVSPVRFSDKGLLGAGRLTISTRNDNSFIPRTMLLPLSDVDRVVTFQVDSLDNFSMDMEVLSTFGTRTVAKAAVLPYVFKERHNRHIFENEVILPLYDMRLKPVGEINFRYQVVKPFMGKPLEITKYDTYWKSTSQIEHSHSKVPAISFVTASSLAGDYADVTVYITRDQHPVVTTNWNISIKGVEIPVGSLTLEKVLQLQNDEHEKVEETLASLSKITDASQVHSTLKNRIVPLTDLLRVVPIHINLNISVLYPTGLEVQESRFCLSCDTDLNSYVDEVLRVVFDHARQVRKSNMQEHGVSNGPGPTRAILFSSANADVCAVLNWKQPNYPVFFLMNGFQTNGRYISANMLIHDRLEDRRCVSLKDATNFATTNNLLGIIAGSDTVSIVPSVVPAVKASGLVLVANNRNGETCDVEGVDGVRSGHVLRFKQSIEM